MLFMSSSSVPTQNEEEAEKVSTISPFYRTLHSLLPLICRHVMRELIETERIYVSELREILEGYAWRMDEPAMQHLIPPKLKGRKRELFGNMEEIYDFHANVFLKELENCRNTPALVGRCFVERVSALANMACSDAKREAHQ
jgi:hypothetical protein